MNDGNNKIEVTKKALIDKDILDWVAVDFVNYCYFRFRSIYGTNNFEINYDRDCMIIKRIIDKFATVDRTKRAVLRYIDWAIAKYTKEKKLQKNMQIGILAFWMEDFLGFKFKDSNKKKKRRKFVVLNDNEKKWISSRQNKKKNVK